MAQGITFADSHKTNYIKTNQYFSNVFTNPHLLKPKSPMSVSFISGITGRHINAIVMNGEWNWQPAFCIVSRRSELR